MNLSLKVDVDTYDGMEQGVPQLLQLFREFNILASFFIPFGPDESGKAVFRIFKKKGFLKKMWRTNPIQLYGFKTMLRGTLLPAPRIGSSFPHILKKIVEEGHEIGIHGYNHVLWQDHLLEMEVGEVRNQYRMGMEAFETSLGFSPSAFAAPGWICSPQSLQILDDFHFKYASDTRMGKYPFFPVLDGKRYQTLQIPSTLPTLDEILGLEDLDPKNVHSHLTDLLLKSKLEWNIHTIHTEVEGTALITPFSEWIRDLKSQRFTFLTCGEIAESQLKHPQEIPESQILLQEIPGRAGPVACQI